MKGYLLPSLSRNRLFLFVLLLIFQLIISRVLITIWLSCFILKTALWSRHSVKIPGLQMRKLRLWAAQEPTWTHTSDLWLSQGSDQEVQSYSIHSILPRGISWLISKLFVFIPMVIRYQWQTLWISYHFFLPNMQRKPGFRTLKSF